MAKARAMWPDPERVGNTPAEREKLREEYLASWDRLYEEYCEERLKVVLGCKMESRWGKTKKKG